MKVSRFSIAVLLFCIFGGCASAIKIELGQISESDVDLVVVVDRRAPEDRRNEIVEFGGSARKLGDNNFSPELLVYIERGLAKRLKGLDQTVVLEIDEFTVVDDFRYRLISTQTAAVGNVVGAHGVSGNTGGFDFIEVNFRGYVDGKARVASSVAPYRLSPWGLTIDKDENFIRAVRSAIDQVIDQIAQE